MKTQHPRRARGFTLIELLVVITIIAVLAGAGFAAGNSAIQKAKKTTALSSISGIESAVSNFYTEYGSMPKTGTTDSTSKTGGAAPDTSLLNTLLGTETGTAALNPRAIKFLSAKEGKNNKGGLIYETGTSTVKGLYDPWGGSFSVMLDLDYDEVLRPAVSAGGATPTLNGRRCAAWSNGADAAATDLGGKAADDVKSW